jgi:hypothetical protein
MPINCKSSISLHQIRCRQEEMKLKLVAATVPLLVVIIHDICLDAAAAPAASSVVAGRPTVLGTFKG